MDMDDYQRIAIQTRIISDQEPQARIIPLLGLAGEVGSLLTEFKKDYRDGEAYRLFPEMVIEELGDILWYLAAIADREGISLNRIAEANLKKVTSKWQAHSPEDFLPGISLARYDSSFESDEQLPRKFTAVINELGAGPNFKVHVEVNGKSYGQILTDNSFQDDGYRFHDVFHLAYMAFLGWSPVSRRNLSLKRKSNPRVDEVEDGGRAIIIEEGISAYVFQHAEGHSFFGGMNKVDFDLLRTIQRMSKHLEVRTASSSQWQHAILEGYRAWREVYRNRGGSIVSDGKHFEYKPPKGQSG